MIKIRWGVKNFSVGMFVTSKNGEKFKFSIMRVDHLQESNVKLIHFNQS